MDTAQWPQEIVVKPMEEIVPNSCSKPSLERRVRPQKEQALNCPRCNSINTKFCYYNNYSLSQPRYFCKTCRRYWTEGGSLRNIPVGGGTRKNKRSSPSSSSSIYSSKKQLPHDHDLIPPPNSSVSENPNKIRQDLNLGFQANHDLKTITDLIQVPNFDNKNQMFSSSTSSTSQLSALELLTGITSRGLNSFVPMPITDLNTVYSSGFSLPEFKSSLNFSLDGFGNGGYGNLQENTTGRLLFPFEDLKQVSSNTTTTTEVEQNKEQHGDSNVYWNGMLGGGSW